MQKLLSLLPQVTSRQITETGLLTVLACLAAGLYQSHFTWFKIALALGLLLLLVPRVYHPVAVLWFALGQLLGLVSTHVLLCLLFGLVVLPVALFRKAMGKDTLRLKQFRQGTGSVFMDRRHAYQPSDLKYPF
jgi:membrane protein implicated in regulation of membrane protease activity